MRNQETRVPSQQFRRLFVGTMVGLITGFVLLCSMRSPIWKEEEAFGGLAPGMEEPSPESRLAIIRTAPDFTLTDQEGKTFRMADVDGKVSLVGFIFTTCNGTCPATTHRMGLIQQELRDRGLLKHGLVRLLSISLDPARDTPDVLRRYMTLYDANPKNWTFLTGAQAAVEKVIFDWDMWVRPAPNGQLDHPSRIFLVDTKRQVREVYNLAFLKPAWVVEDIELLLGEDDKGKG